MLLTSRIVTLIGGAAYSAPTPGSTVVCCNTNHPELPADVRYISSIDSISALYTCIQRLKYAFISCTAANHSVYAGVCSQYKVPFDYYSRFRGETYKKHDTWSARLQARYGFFPLTGVLALAHLLQYEPSHVFVTGMNLYKGGSCIDAEKNAQCLRDLLVDYDGLLTYDDTLRGALWSH